MPRTFERDGVLEDAKELPDGTYERGQTMTAHTHQKRPYKAQCLQWASDNTCAVITTLQDFGCEVNTYGDQLMLRWKKSPHKPAIEMLSVGMWLRLGENGELKVMPDAEFRAKYEELQ
jgi:hypothetical protein